MHVSDALVLRTYRYGEADRIVVFLTADRGKKRGVAKNATKSRRRFGAALEPLTRGRAAYMEREHRELVRLDRIDPSSSPLMPPTRARAAQPDDAQRLGHASYFAELLDEWAPENAANATLFRLGAAIGDALVQGGRVEALARYFEYWLLRLEGVYPSLEVCAQCEQASLADGAVLSERDRTYLCQGCAPRGSRLSSESIAFLRRAGSLSPDRAAADPVARGPLREIEQVHAKLIAAHLEKELRSARVVQELRPHS